MKRIKSILIIIILLLISGCAKVEYEMEINKDKSMNLSIIEAMDKSYVSNFYEIFDEGKIKELEDNGFYIQKYNEDSMIGYQLTKTINNIDSVSTDAKINSTDALNAILKKDKPIFTIQKGFLKNKYIASFDALSFINSTEEDISNNIKNSNIEFRIKLPYEPISNNATDVLNNGKVYVWDINKISKIEFEFELYNMTNLYIVVGIISFIIISLIISIFKSLSNKPKVDFKPSYNTKYNKVEKKDNINKQPFINENIAIDSNINTEDNNQNTINQTITNENVQMESNNLFNWEQNDNNLNNSFLQNQSIINNSTINNVSFNNENNLNNNEQEVNSIIQPNFIQTNNSDDAKKE